MEWGIYCVSLEWFLESINYQGCVDETRYFLPIDDEAKQKLLTPSIKDINRYVIAVAYLIFFELPNLATDLQLTTPNLDLHQR
jgi:hypothetical protein